LITNYLYYYTVSNKRYERNTCTCQHGDCSRLTSTIV